MTAREKNFAYIDAANLHKGIADLGWLVDYKRFRVWLKEKYSVERAYLFIGLIPRLTKLYTHLQEAGFTLVFKETVYDGDGRVKGNCDADLVLRAVRDSYEQVCERMVIVAGDGDCACLVQFLKEKDKLKILLAPNHQKCSILLKRTAVPMTFLDEFSFHLSVKKEKAPGGDGTPQGSFS